MYTYLLPDNSRTENITLYSQTWRNEAQLFLDIMKLNWELHSYDPDFVFKGLRPGYTQQVIPTEIVLKVNHLLKDRFFKEPEPLNFPIMYFQAANLLLPFK